MFGIDEALLILASTFALKIAIEVGAEIVAEWVFQSSSQPVAELSCSLDTEGMFITLVDGLEQGVSCAGLTLAECIEACPAMLKLVAY